MEHEIEPVPGLPQRLPPGERILWQGAPRMSALLRRAVLAPLPISYVTLLEAWFVGTAQRDGGGAMVVLRAGLLGVGLAALCVVAAAAFCLLTARSTMFTLTNRRLVVRSGVALSMTVNIPLSVIQSAGLWAAADGTGEVMLQLSQPHRVHYLALFPYARLWHVTRVQPLLRGIADASYVAGLLADALAASVDAPAARRPVRVAASRIAAAA